MCSIWSGRWHCSLALQCPVGGRGHGKSNCVSSVCAHSPALLCTHTYLWGKSMSWWASWWTCQGSAKLTWGCKGWELRSVTKGMASRCCLLICKGRSWWASWWTCQRSAKLTWGMLTLRVSVAKGMVSGVLSPAVVRDGQTSWEVVGTWPPLVRTWFLFLFESWWFLKSTFS